MRNQDDMASGEWYIEARNVADDFVKVFGAIPSEIGLGISCNSQYTDSQAVALLEWVEFTAADGAAQPAAGP